MTVLMTPFNYRLSRLRWKDACRSVLSSGEMMRAQIPPEFWRVRFHLIPDDAAYKRSISKFCAGLKEKLLVGDGLTFSGPTGTGKTAAAVLVAKKVMLHGGTALMLSPRSIEGFSLNGIPYDDEHSLEEWSCLVDWLIIDDLGERMKKSGQRLAVEDLVRRRSELQKSTCITTRFGEDVFDAVFGDSLTSILSSGNYLVKFDGIDWRSIPRLARCL